MPPTWITPAIRTFLENHLFEYQLAVFANQADLWFALFFRDFMRQFPHVTEGGEIEFTLTRRVRVRDSFFIFLSPCADPSNSVFVLGSVIMSTTRPNGERRFGSLGVRVLV